MSARPAPILLVSALAVVLAACGGGAAPSDAPDATGTPVATDAPLEPAQPTPGTALDACGIVTTTDIGAAFGADDVAAGTLEVTATTLSPGHTECTYEGDFGRVIVALTPEDGANLYDAARGSYDDASDYSGIGDGAFWSADNDRAFVWQGSVAVMFTIFPAEAELRDVGESLSKAVVGKL